MIEPMICRECGGRILDGEECVVDDETFHQHCADIYLMRDPPGEIGRDHLDWGAFNGA